MPTYEYFCKKCGAEFEQFQHITAEPLKICPKCGEAAVERKISGGTGLIFKGSGFYITDYAGKKISDSTPVKPSPKPSPAAPKKNAAKPTGMTSESTLKKTASE